MLGEQLLDNDPRLHHYHHYPVAFIKHCNRGSTCAGQDRDRLIVRVGGSCVWPPDNCIDTLLRPFSFIAFYLMFELILTLIPRLK